MSESPHMERHTPLFPEKDHCLALKALSLAWYVRIAKFRMLHAEILALEQQRKEQVHRIRNSRFRGRKAKIQSMRTSGEAHYEHIHTLKEQARICLKGIEEIRKWIGEQISDTHIAGYEEVAARYGLRALRMEQMDLLTQEEEPPAIHKQPSKPIAAIAMMRRKTANLMRLIMEAGNARWIEELKHMLSQPRAGTNELIPST